MKSEEAAAYVAGRVRQAQKYPRPAGWAPHRSGGPGVGTLWGRPGDDISPAKIAVLRQLLGLSGEALGDRLVNLSGNPVSARTIRAWEAGRQGYWPSESVIDQMGELLSIHTFERDQMVAAGRGFVLARGVDGGWSLGAAARALDVDASIIFEWG